MEGIGKGRLLIYQVYFCSDPASKRTPASVAKEINTVDTCGSTKKRVVMRFASELDEIGHLLINPKVGELSR
ncbi:MAG TPA: hypothetical protein VFI73_09825 [Candidatus Nitrosopolaris sp.]|nr:hypothetical protein [Candidatus Nitrosopolaris sp.]